jgi:serine/threonine-protein kinase
LSVDRFLERGEAATMVGQEILGKYKISRLLDEGGMSKVYLARQATPARDVVVKVLKEQMLSVPRAREHFRREIHILARFRHPHAVAYYDSAPNDPSGPLLVMEYLRGADLNVLLQRTGRFTPERTGRLLAQLCDVLQSAHDQGIIHRDLKPGNLMVLSPGTPQETLKLMDFGLAKMQSMLYISPDELVDFSIPAASGTPEYISPEMIRGGEMDARGDLYSVGIILFEMLTGRRPFVGDTDALLDAHVEQRPPTLAARGLRDAPPALEELVRSCLGKHPDQRPRSAAELLQMYELAVGKRFAVARHSGLQPIPAPAPPPAPSKGAASGANAVLARAAAMLRGAAARGAAVAEPPTAVTPPPTPVDRNAMLHSIEASMPEAMALVKLKGFIYDLGGEVIESVPGMIRVHVPDPQAAKKSGGLFGWFDRGRSAVQTSAGTDIELRMERNDPARPNLLTVTLVMRPRGGMMTPEWKSRCQKIGRDLGAYLMR